MDELASNAVDAGRSLPLFLAHTAGSAAVDLLLVLGPLIVLGLMLAALEQVHRAILRRWLGVRVVFWTGWIGTSIHELSHAGVALLFGHKIDRIKLFDPDAEDGMLGYVRHRYNPRSYYNRVGNFFIGVAPLLGGSLVLLLVAALLLNGATPEGLFDAPTPELSAPGAHAWLEAGLRQAVLNLTPRSVAPAQALTTGLFILLAACVGAHIAPSRIDIENAAGGFLLILALLYGANLVAGLFGGVPRSVVSTAVTGTWPLVVALSLATVTSTVLAGVYLLLLLCLEGTSRILPIRPKEGWRTDAWLIGSVLVAAGTAIEVARAAASLGR